MPLGPVIGHILSRATTRTAKMQPLKNHEGRVREGMLVIIEHSEGLGILGTISRITVYNEFFEPGEVWSEAIREGRIPPIDIARRYVVAEIDLHGVITERGLQTLDKPPEPGARVYLATPEQVKIVARGSNNLIKIGSLYGYTGLDAYLNLDAITMHMAVIGVTGSGKSNTVGVLIEELGQLNGVSIGGFRARTIPVLVFDAHGDYLDYYRNPLLVQSYDKVYRVAFPRARREPTIEPAEHIELKLDLNTYKHSIGELAELIYTVTRGGVEGYELQLNALTNLLQTVVDEPPSECDTGHGVDLNCVFADKLGFNALLEILNDMVSNKRVHQATAEAVRRTLESFHEVMVRRHGIIPVDATQATINDEFIEDIVDPEAPKLTIVDFSADGAPGVDLRVKQFVLAFITRLLFLKFVEYRQKGEDRVLLTVIEEAQNYAPNTRSYPIGYSVARNILAMIATQGRKFGLSLLLVTQRPLFVDPVVLSMMNTFIIHRVSPGDVKFVETVTGGLPPHIRSKLTNLETGVAIVTGQMNPLPQPVLVHVRKRKAHAIGSLGGG